VKDDKNWVIVGRFGRPHGLKGYISVYSFTEPRENIQDYPNWYVQLNGEWTPLTILNTEAHTRFIVAMVDGYQEREKVAQLTNLDIAIQSEQLPTLDSGEYYWHQLVGMTVVNTSGVLMGTVTEIMATGSNDVLVVTGEARYLIPYRVGAVVLEVSEDKRQITVDWDTDYL
jgi:16S rRNA processing protein RimM